MDEKLLSYEYVRGLVCGEGCFTFSSDKRGGNNIRLPAFSIGMSDVDTDLIELVKITLGLRNIVHTYAPRKIRTDSYNRRSMSVLIVRDFGQLKNILVPLFYKKLHGNKATQFEDWINKIESDPLVPEIYKLIPKLYKNGYYDKNWRKYD